MAARLTDRQKKKIIADYARLESYNAAAKLNGVSANTVKNCVEKMQDFAEKCEQKKEQNTTDILEYMDSQKDKVCEVIGVYLDALVDLGNFDKCSPSQLTTAIGTLIDKWTAISGGVADTREDDALSKSLKELADGLESEQTNDI